MSKYALTYKQEEVFHFIKSNPLSTAKAIFLKLDYESYEIKSILCQLRNKNKIDAHYKLSDTKRLLYSVKESENE